MDTTTTRKASEPAPQPAREESGVRRRPELDMDPLALIEADEPTLILDDSMLDEVRVQKPSTPPPPPEYALRKKGERFDLDVLVAGISKTANDNSLPANWEIPKVGGVPSLAAPVMQRDDSKIIKLGPLSLTWG